MSNTIAVSSKEIISEAVEVCPYCDEDNIFPNWNIAEKGFIATCQHCGEQIMLCDECLHAEDILLGNNAIAQIVEDAVISKEEQNKIVKPIQKEAKKKKNNA